MYALDPATGAEKWTYTLNEGLTTAPAVIGHTVYVTSTLGNMAYAINADNGQLAMDLPNRRQHLPSPAIADGVAYFGAYDGVLLCSRRNFKGTSRHRYR